ncbi:hypothetical protein [Bradyrhizobium centrosematis]|uniref:hypothetical protein n=1 Tax=Bradyrhizobium centrosematis TaxID=1300039 RepID=UPI00388F2778
MGEDVFPAKLAWALIFLYSALSAVASDSVTRGIALMAMAAPIWQTIFAVVGAIAVSITIFIRITGMTAPGPAG